MSVRIRGEAKRRLDEIPWSPGPKMSVLDKRKFERAVRRFWGGTQVKYRNGEKVRTRRARKVPKQTDFGQW